MTVYDFGRFGRVLDLGGGYGGVLAELLRAHPAQTGAVFDLAYLEAGARAYLERAGAAGRAAFLGGSFFEAVPGGFELILMKFIIHDWGDEEAHAILAQARASADPGATLVLLEQVVPETIAATPEHQAVIRGDLTMMGMGGKERTAAEYGALLVGAGWRLEQIIPSGAAFSVIEARPA
jgi:SAM-dependent methyltransferase